MVEREHWIDWHDAYEDPASSRSRRLASMCAGQGRDVIEVLAGHHRGEDVSARLVELDAALVADARSRAADAGFEEVAFDTQEGRSFAVGTNRLVGAASPFRLDRRMFTFVGDGADAHL